jgi:hypothetical protein
MYLKAVLWNFLGDPTQFPDILVIDLSFSLKARLRSGRSVLCALFLCFPFLSFVLASFTFGFVHQLQKAENIIFWVMENIFDSGLDCTMIPYTILGGFVT